MYYIIITYIYMVGLVSSVGSGVLGEERGGEEEEGGGVS